MFVGTDGVRKELQAGEVGARTYVPSAGTLILTESYSRSWQILENGYRLERSKNEQGLPTFKVTEAGEISLIHDGTTRRAWLSLQLIFFVVVLVQKRVFQKATQRSYVHLLFLVLHLKSHCHLRKLNSKDCRIEAQRLMR